MREILFRGKSKENGEWLVGFYIMQLVIPETVGQFIGLYDKNGSRIFEGDIVSYKIDEYGVILYDVETTRFYVSFDTWGTDFDHLYGKELEVIGNIHDNPELLEESEDTE